MKLIITIMLTFTTITYAETEKKDVTYTIKDGYGQYDGTGKTKWQAAKVAWEQCVTTKVDAYEKRHGIVPNFDTVDLFIDACINK